MNAKLSELKRHFVHLRLIGNLQLVILENQKVFAGSSMISRGTLWQEEPFRSFKSRYHDTHLGDQRTLQKDRNGPKKSQDAHASPTIYPFHLIVSIGLFGFIRFVSFSNLLSKNS